MQECEQEQSSEHGAAAAEDARIRGRDDENSQPKRANRLLPALSCGIQINLGRNLNDRYNNDQEEQNCVGCSASQGDIYLTTAPGAGPPWLPVLPPRIYTFRFAIILEKK